MSSSRLLQIKANTTGNEAPQHVAASCHILINGEEEKGDAGLGHQELCGKQGFSTAPLSVGDAAVNIRTS